MSAAYLVPGQEVVINNKHYQIDRYIDDEIQLTDMKNKRSIQLNSNNILNKIALEQIKCVGKESRYVPKDISTVKGERAAALLEFYPEHLQNEMKIRRIFIEAYLKNFGDLRSKIPIQEGLKTLWDKRWGKAPSSATVARWLKRYVESGKDIRALCPAHFRKGNRMKRYDPFVIEACQTAVSRIYLQREKASLSKTHTEALKLISTENHLRPEVSKLPFPSQSLLKSLLNDLPAYDVYAARHGQAAANLKFRNAVNHAPSEGPLTRVEIDHTQMDIICVDPVTGIVLERPWLTLIIDVYTRCILGFIVTYDPPSHTSVAKALKMALMPKVDIQKRWPSIKGEWKMFGQMQNLVADNGFEFHGSSLQDACFTLGINISYCPREKGWWKAVIERVIGTLNSSVTDGLPGRTFSSITEKGDYQPQLKATLSLKALEEMIAKWIVDVYHETIHTTLGRKPRAVWEQEVQLEDIPIVTNIHELDAIMGRIEKRNLSHKGIEINSLRYNSDELGAFRQQFGNIKDITVKWDPEDMGYIYVLPPDGSLIKVPVVSEYTDYATGISHYQHKLYMQYAKDRPDEKDDIEQLILAKSEIAELAKADAKKINANKRKLKRHRLQSSKPTTKSKQTELVQVNVDSHDVEADTDIIPTFEAKKSQRKHP